MQLHHKVDLLGQILIGKFTPWKIPKKTDYDIFPPILGLGPRSSAANFWPQLEIGGGSSHRDEGVGSVNSDLTEVDKPARLIIRLLMLFGFASDLTNSTNL